jgi:hypothetical protein
VGDLAALLQQRQNRRDTAAGRAAAEEFIAEAATFEEAIKKGLITADQSPFFRRGAEEQFGRLSADRFSSRMTLAMQTELANSTDPDEFDEFVARQRGVFLDEIGAELSPEFLAGFNPRADAHMANSRNSFNAQAGSRLIQQVHEQTYQEHRNTIIDGLRGGLPLEVIAEGLDITNTRGLRTGLSGRTANEITVQAVADAAETLEDERVLRILDIVRGGSGPLSGTAKAQAAIEATESRIFAQRQARQRWEWSVLDRERTDRERDIVTSYLDTVADASNPLDVPVAPFRDELLANGSPALALSLTDYRSRLAEGNRPSNPQVVDQLIYDIYTVPDKDDTEYVDVRTLINADLNRDDFEAVKRHLDARDGDGDPAGLTPMKLLGQFQSQVRSSFVSQFDAFDQQKVDAANAAVRELTDQFLAEQPSHPEWTPRDWNRWFTETAENIVKAGRARIPSARPEVTRADVATIESRWRVQRLVSEPQLTGIIQELKGVGFVPESLSDETLDYLISLDAIRIKDGRIDEQRLSQFLTAQRRLYP